MTFIVKSFNWNCLQKLYFWEVWGKFLNWKIFLNFYFWRFCISVLKIDSNYKESTKLNKLNFKTSKIIESNHYKKLHYFVILSSLLSRILLEKIYCFVDHITMNWQFDKVKALTVVVISFLTLSLTLVSLYL